MTAESELEAAEKAPDAEIRVPDRQLRLALRTDPMAVQINAEKQQILDHLQALQEHVQEGVADPKQEELKRRLAICEEKYQVCRKSMHQELIEDQREAAAAGIDSLKRKIQLLTTQEVRLRKKSSELEMDVKQIGKSSIDVEMMRSEIAAVQDVMGRLSSELERTRVELQSDARTGWARVSLMSEASPPHRANANVRLPATIAAGLASLLLVLLCVVWLNAPRDELSSYFSRDWVDRTLSIEAASAQHSAAPCG